MVLNVICVFVYGESYDIEDEEFKLIMKYNNYFVCLFKGFNILEMMFWLWYLLIEEGRIFCEVKELRDFVLNVKYCEYKRKFDGNLDKDGIKINDLMDVFLKVYYEV